MGSESKGGRDHTLPTAVIFPVEGDLFQRGGIEFATFGQKSWPPIIMTQQNRNLWPSPVEILPLKLRLVMGILPLMTLAQRSSSQEMLPL